MRSGRVARLVQDCLAALPCLPCFASPRLASPRLASPRLASPCLALPCLALPCLALPSLALPLPLPLPLSLSLFLSRCLHLVALSCVYLLRLYLLVSVRSPTLISSGIYRYRQVFRYHILTCIYTSASALLSRYFESNLCTYEYAFTSISYTPRVLMCSALSLCMEVRVLGWNEASSRC